MNETFEIYENAFLMLLGAENRKILLKTLNHSFLFFTYEFHLSNRPETLLDFFHHSETDPEDVPGIIRKHPPRIHKGQLPHVISDRSKLNFWRILNSEGISSKLVSFTGVNWGFCAKLQTKVFWMSSQNIIFIFKEGPMNFLEKRNFNLSNRNYFLEINKKEKKSLLHTFLI